MGAQVNDEDDASTVSAVAIQASSAKTLVDASVARVATLALRTGLALLVATSGIGTAVLIAQGGSVALVAQGALIFVVSAACLMRVHLAVTILRRRGAVIAFVVAFCALGAVEHGLQPAYSNVLLSLVWISAVVESPIGVLTCVFVAWGGFTLDVALEGRLLQAEHGSLAAQSVGELAILLVSAGLTFAAVNILRLTLAQAPSGLERVRAGAADSLTPALAAAVRGDPIGLLSRGDPLAITASLSAAECAALTLLAQGLAPKQAARELGVAISTVRSHIASAKRKTGPAHSSNSSGCSRNRNVSIELVPPSRPAGWAGPGGSLVRRGADLVHVAEDLYVRLFVLTLVLLALGSGWSVWARLEDSQRGQLGLTVAFAAAGVIAAIAGIALRGRAYGWLRHDRLRQSLPAVAAVVMLLADGPHSATWWMAFALLFVMASVSSTSLTLLAAVVAAGAYIGGTLLYDSPLIYQGDTSNVIGAAMLVVNALVARAVAEVFGSFVLRLHRLEAEIAEGPAPPLKVRNLADSSREPSGAPAVGRPVRRRTRTAAPSRLTARQLEVALLVRDGLHQDEIAACLSISRRQVERLMEQARARVGAATTSELVAMLVNGRFVPARDDDE